MSGILEVKGLTKRFGGLAAVDNVSFSVREGGISGLIGPNGAGKTTIFNLITGVYKVTEGSVSFSGSEITNMEPFRIADRGITRTFQNIRLFKNLTVYENVLTACHMSAKYSIPEALLRLPRYLREEKALRAKAEDLLSIMGLTERRDVQANNLPYGLQRRLEIVRALALDPKLLLLDEPAAGMNPDETEQLMRLISEIRTRFKLTVLVIEHHMDLVMRLCESIVVLNFGQKLAEGTADEIRGDPRVVEAYLGSGGN
ncbi:MAG TPA: ABC transporter ATP-binding protein [Spirochaetia bacterium]|nr:ABC transporter ATP-binding protein [Spirochaetales bacterium]HRY81218.1 ABC transporter ATP-binding protein [Spirochaetia bacterium]HRZ88896.1 ABC transporter ATP-binding protein [Spirochaetia bacterium]